MMRSSLMHVYLLGCFKWMLPPFQARLPLFCVLHVWVAALLLVLLARRRVVPIFHLSTSVNNFHAATGHSRLPRSTELSQRPERNLNEGMKFVSLETWKKSEIKWRQSVSKNDLAVLVDTGTTYSGRIRLYD
jgi:hypothetical protein